MTTPNKIVVPPPPEHERGPKTWEKLREDERTLLDSIDPESFNILNTITPRLWTPDPRTEPVLALEVIQPGHQYKGVIFQMHNFRLKTEANADGYVPVKFSVRIFRAPSDFVHDDQFDDYARDVILAWVGYIQTHDFRVITNIEPKGGKH